MWPTYSNSIQKAGIILPHVVHAIGYAVPCKIFSGHGIQFVDEVMRGEVRVKP
jgi:hypothetical protein